MVVCDNLLQHKDFHELIIAEELCLQGTPILNHNLYLG